MAYVTKDEVKKYLGVSWNSALDSFVDKVIAACQLYIEKYCGDDRFGKRLFEAPDPDEPTVRRFDGTGDKRLYVGDLFDIEGVTISGYDYELDSDVYAYPMNNEDEAFQYLELSQPETRLNSNSRVGSLDPYVFERGQGTVEIEGYWYFTETPPADITLAMMKLVGAVIKENISDGDVREKKSEELGDYRVSYQDVDKIAHSLNVTDILDQYKRKGASSGAGVIQVS